MTIANSARSLQHERPAVTRTAVGADLQDRPQRCVERVEGGNHLVDATFHVPFKHRVRFTGDVLGGDAEVLLNCLEPLDERVRVMTIVDAGIAENVPGLRQKIDAFFTLHADRIESVDDIFELHGGEDCKNTPGVVDDLLARFNRLDLDRRNYVLVIGGGAVLDAVGYAAAIAHRGIRLIRLPTTTLAQDDSGIGVKNAVNLFEKKNWKGTFAVPWAVINDAALVATLPDRDFRNGFSEAVKVALLKDAEFFDDLCRDAAAIADRDMAPALDAIRRSAMWHLRHITEGGDPFEMLEARPLDFGHWSAHKLEAMTNFELRHGEAVAIGLAIDCLYSQAMFGFEDADRVIRCFQDLKLPLDHPALSRTDELMDGLEEFRQHLGGRLTITMVEAPGCPLDVHEIDNAVMLDAIHELQRRVGLSTVTP